MREIYKTINLVRGDKIDIIICRGANISISMFKMSLYNSLKEENRK